MEKDQYTFKELATLVQGLQSRFTQKIIGVDGLEGVGKATFTQALAGEIAGAVVIHGSSFQKIKSERVENADASVSPNIDWERFDAEVLTPLRYGQPVSYRVYDEKKDVMGEKISVPVGALIIVEGEYVTQNRYREMYDFTVWIEAQDSVRFTRILDKDGERVLREWQEKEVPTERNYIAKEMQNVRADLIVSGTSADFKEGYYGVLKP